MMRSAAASALACAVWLAAPAATAQVPQTRLERPDTEFPQDFSSIQGLRELPDGRLLLADALGQALTVVDLDAGTADTIGRVGGGPEEYRQPDGVFPLPGDSTLLVDLGNGRLTVLGPDFGFGETMPIAQAPTRPGAMEFRLPSAVDRRGRLYFQAFGRMRPGGGMLDSAAVLRWDRARHVTDTVAMVKLEEIELEESRGPSERSVMMRPRPLTPRDAWAASPDGRVGVVRSEDYHVEWILPDGGVVRGAPVDYRPVRVGAAEREAWMSNLGRGGLMVGVENQNGRITTTFRRGGGGGAGPGGLRADDLEWPDVMPPFRPRGVHAPPDGTLWVERYGPARRPVTMGVFDREAQLVRQVVLPAGRQIVGFGHGVVYLARLDEFDLMWLERYRLPS